MGTGSSKISRQGRLAQSVGDRGEFYSYMLEKSGALDPTKIRWVARDDESLGYDIEDVTGAQRYIDAKASSSPEVRFYLSSNEYDVALRHGEHYEIQFWGNIDLGRATRNEYPKLRATGYPFIYTNVAELLRNGTLRAEPAAYLVRPS